MFSCKDEQCIDVRWRCDGYNDCGEWEDEQDCVCTYDQFRCSNRQCVEGSRACDGYYDCLDRSDELQCGCESQGMVTCGNYGNQCLPPHFLCDGEIDCLGGWDEQGCPQTDQPSNCPLSFHFSISSTFFIRRVTCDESCVSVTKLCDGNRDCNDGTDEDGCGESDQDKFKLGSVFKPMAHKNPTFNWRCEALTLQTCGQLTYNVTRMPNFLGHVTQLKTAMSPEYVMLTTIVHTSTIYTVWRLLHTHILKCQLCSNGTLCCRRLPCRSLCEDVRRSCAKVLLAAALTWPRFLSCESFPTKSKETDCYHPGNGKAFFPHSSPTEECSYGQFKCRNSTDGPGHQCLPMTSRCDGVTQCNDGSDEVDCNCNDLNRFRCRSGGKCLTMSHVCDGHNDCPENSDEDSCSTYIPQQLPAYEVMLNLSAPGNCTAAQLSCYDYSCVPKSSWCDGNDDCPDGSDEMNCCMYQNGFLDISLLSPNQLGKRITEEGDNAVEKGILNRYDPITSRWLPICADSWNFLLSHQVCSQMGYSKAKSFETVIYVPTRHRRSCHVHLRNGDNQRIRRIQGALECGSQHCRSERHVQITCKPRSCGKRNDVTDGRRIYTRILGGRTSRDRTWPWVTSLTLPGMKHVCGATLVRPEWLISAAHCFQEREGLGVWKARLGTGNGGVMEFNVTDVVVHPRYNAEAVDFDIALVKLGGRVRSFNAEPLCLPTFDIDPGSYCVIAGWGVTEGLQGGTRKLQEGSVHVIERSTCQRYYPNHVISDRMMCAGRGGTVDACSGDSGGPMMCWHPQRRQWQLSGVTSWGSSCTPHSAPGVYTDVKYFSKWAERQM
uniref:Peptidase S1 domain-containing protein n=1 Tax=Ciona savignyi TaxID=51511 RepID=H2ZGI1_CIOSA